MLIREIKATDNNILKQIIQTSLQDLDLAIEGTAYFDPQLDHLSDYYQNLQHAAYWVVELNQKVVGGIGIAPLEAIPSTCELQKLYLSSEAQGLGFSKGLMKTALSFASQHYEACYLETNHNLKTACVLYEKFDFKLLNSPLSKTGHIAMDRWYIKSFPQHED